MFGRSVLIIGAVALVLLGIQQWRISGLKHSNEKLTTSLNQANANLKSRDETIASLELRETENKQIEAGYDKIIDEIKRKPNAPVPDAIRHAIDSDIVR